MISGFSSNNRDSLGIEVDGQRELRLIEWFGEVNGAVDINTTPSVQYTYSDPGTGSLLTSMVYSNGRTIDYSYGSGMSNANAALDQAIGRMDAIVDGANSGDAGQVLEQYSYLGLNTIVGRNHPQSFVSLSLRGANSSIGSGGDQYVGLDRFGRVVDQNWVNSSTGVSTNNLTYTYDSNSNVTAENNLLNSAYSQTFTYDPLNRLTANTLGGAANQSWTLDSQGNWSSVTTNGTTQTRTANAQNQITSVSGSTTPTYDANGNMTTDQFGNTYVYNAWNQLVAVKNSTGVVIAQYTYDARGYRISETYPQGGPGIPAGTTNYIYYDAQWQAIETRTNGTAASDVTSQMVWSAAYINAAVLQDTYSGGVIQPNSRLYFEQDANWNTTAIVGLVSGNWQVVRRFTYSPYGTITVLNADWSTPPAGTQPTVDNLYQGMTLDPVTGLYYERNRNYSPSLGVWISQDPLQYINGANTYQFVMSNPVGNLDPNGAALVGAIWGGISGAIAEYTGAAEAGGGFWTDAAAAAIGGGLSAGAGLVAPPGTGWAIAASGASAAAANTIGQFMGNGGFNNFNPTEAAASGAAGAIGESVLAPVSRALSELDSSVTKLMAQGMNTLMKGLLKGSLGQLSKTLTGGQPPQSPTGSKPTTPSEAKTKDSGAGPSENQPPVPTNQLKTSWSHSQPNKSEPIYQQWSDGSWHYAGQTGGN